MRGLTTSCIKDPHVVLLQSEHREGLAVATNGSRVEMISAVAKNEATDGGSKKDANNITFDLSFRSLLKLRENIFQCENPMLQ